MISKISIIPRYAETDQMGIIHHSVYPIWYEQGRVAFCNEIGFPFDKIEAQGLYHALIDLEVKYIKPTYFNQSLTLLTKITSFGKVKLTFSYELLNDKEECINKGTTTLAWLDHTLKPVNIFKHHPKIYELLSKQLES